MTLDELNAAGPARFVEAAGFAYESSPWVAEAASASLPFRNVEAMCAALSAAVASASIDRQIALICAHPDLAGRVESEGRLTPASRGEQLGAGLADLTGPEREQFAKLNEAYRARYGFPFVVCVREHDKGSILAAMAARVRNDRDAEIRTALEEINKIAGYRL